MYTSLGIAQKVRCMREEKTSKSTLVNLIVSSSSAIHEDATFAFKPLEVVSATFVST